MSTKEDYPLTTTLCVAEQDALLRVARAAKDVADDAYYSEEGGPHCLVDAPFIYDLEEALKEVEHLLG